ncbi:MAG: hypothetical protein KDA76_07215 [Planctomycetaceae bacterium]|nr:hypothetical protein [Planctomycetaceae bacterium]
MNNNSWCVCLVLGFLIVVPMAGWAEPPGDHKPLTTFRPDRDFLQVPNVGVSENGWRGTCLGTVESSITHWETYSKNPGQVDRLADVGERIKQTRPQGDEFLKQINRYAHNQSYETATTAPQGGERLADLLFADLNRTGKPQVLGLDMPDGNRHAVVVWDATKSNDKIIFSVGDPNFPNKTNLALAYDPDTKEWVNLNFPPGTFASGEPKPCFIRWDEKNLRQAEIPKKDKFEKLMSYVEAASQNPSITAGQIGRELGLDTPLFSRLTPETRSGLDYPPPTQEDKDKFLAELAAYNQEVANHNRQAKAYIQKVTDVKQDQAAGRADIDRYNEAGAAYRALPPHQRSPAEYKRLMEWRARLDVANEAMGKRLDMLTKEKNEINQRKSTLDSRRNGLLSSARRVDSEHRPATAVGVGPGTNTFE